MRRVIMLLLAGMLAGCIGNPPRTTVPVLHDLGDAGTGGKAPALPIASLEVRAASWLSSSGQVYRLLYADPLQRHTFLESRWAAPPAELIERLLQRRIIFGQPESNGQGCRLSLQLDELEQRFETSDVSRMLLEVRAQLLSARGDQVLARRAFVIEKPAKVSDARGGVLAAREAVSDLTDELGVWLASVARDRPQTVAGCKVREAGADKRR